MLSTQISATSLRRCTASSLSHRRDWKGGCTVRKYEQKRSSRGLRKSCSNTSRSKKYRCRISARKSLTLKKSFKRCNRMMRKWRTNLMTGTMTNLVTGTMTSLMIRTMTSLITGSMMMSCMLRMMTINRLERQRAIG